MSQTPQKSAYRVKNWSQYNAALVKRGSLTVWVDQEALDAWHYQGPPRWGAQFIYSDTAIQCLLTLRVVFHLPLRATQGLAHSIFQLILQRYVELIRLPQVVIYRMVRFI